MQRKDKNMAEIRQDNLYNEKSIESLSPLEFTRLRPGVYAGDTTYATQLLVEVFSNAVDEFRLGHGNKIEVYIYEKDNAGDLLQFLKRTDKIRIKSLTR